MLTCPIRTALWLAALAGAELDDRHLALAARLLDRARFDG